jgi:L-iditol 2-dehydrogenase
MKNAVIRPQAMIAPMFGMTMLDRNVPNRWACTRTLAPADGLMVRVIVVAIWFLSVERDVTPITHRLEVVCNTYGHVAKYSDTVSVPVSVVFGSCAYYRRVRPDSSKGLRQPMKALRFYAPEDVRLEEVAEPECGPDEVKLRVRNCSTCGTDVKIFHNGHQNLTPPRTIGHEIAGEVVEVGAEVNATYGSEWKVGDRAQVIAAVPCGECYECRKGWMAVCANQTSVGYQYDGGFAEYMIVPRQVLKVDGLNRIPENVGYDEASAAEPFACAINAQELLGIEPGDTVVVFGAGPIGCMHIRIARGVHECGPVYLVDVNAERLKMSAEAVQPDETIDGSEVDVVERVMELTGGRGADVVITATAANVAQEQAISMAARNGRISFFGGLPKTDPTITCDSNLVHYRQLHIHGANGSAPEHNKRALEYISTGQVPVKDLITRHIPLDDVLSAFDIVKNGEAIKVTVEP